MRLNLSGESVLVAAKDYELFVKEWDVIHEMSILTSHKCFLQMFSFCGLAKVLYSIFISCDISCASMYYSIHSLPCSLIYSSYI